MSIKVRFPETMKKNSVTLPMLIFVAVLCFSVLSFPTTASGNEGGPDAVVGALPVLYGRAGGSTFEVTASAQRGGTVTPSASNSAEGGTVHFTISPYGGYETASIAAITAAGTRLEICCDEDGGYYFTMPAENVVIDVSFQYLRTA